MVRKTVGYDDRCYPVYEVIGYYASRADAMLALADYNANPYDVKLSKLTFKELYEKFVAAVQQRYRDQFDRECKIIPVVIGDGARRIGLE